MAGGFAKYCLQALDVIEDAHHNNHLFYSKEYKNKYPQEFTDPIKRAMIEFGTTTHTNFFTQYMGDRKNNYVMCFRLKPKVSASKALRALLTSGETIIDCGSGLMLAYIYACLLALEDKYGAKDGQLRFDILFGSAIHETPTVQRLLFTNNPLPTGTKNYVIDQANNTSPLNPFSFLFGFSDLAYKAIKENAPGAKINEKKYMQQYQIGSIVCMQGNEHYNSKHPAGIDANYNSIYVGYDKDNGPLLRVFGQGKTPLTEQQLKDKHVESYNQPRSVEDTLIPAASSEAYPAQITAKDVYGLSVYSNINVKANIWEKFINDPLPTFLTELRKYLQEQLIARKIELSKHQRPLLAEDQQPLPTISINKYYFPTELNSEQKNLLLFLGAQKSQNGARTSSKFVSMSVESSFLDKSIRDQVGLERKIKRLSPKEVELLKLFYSEATIEPSQDKTRHLITMPSVLFHKKVECIIDQLGEVEGKISRVQQAYRAKKGNKLSSYS